MKKDKLMAILYYAVLIVGLIGMVVLIVLLEKGYEDDVRAFFDKLGVFTFLFIYGCIALYLYILKVIVSTKGFQTWESKKEKKRKKNEVKYKKNWKKILKIWIILEIPHMLSAFYLLNCVHNGMEMNFVIKVWIYSSTMTPVALFAAWLYYKSNYKDVRG